VTVIFGSRTYVLDTDENVSISINVGIQDTICPLKMDDHCTGKIEVSVKSVLTVKSLALYSMYLYFSNIIIRPFIINPFNLNGPR
jgi:hypothetical protein